MFLLSLVLFTRKISIYDLKGKRFMRLIFVNKRLTKAKKEL